MAIAAQSLNREGRLMEVSTLNISIITRTFTL
jgi:hypothetical protein